MEDRKINPDPSTALLAPYRDWQVVEEDLVQYQDQHRRGLQFVFGLVREATVPDLQKIISVYVKSDYSSYVIVSMTANDRKNMRIMEMTNEYVGDPEPEDFPEQLNRIIEMSDDSGMYKKGVLRDINEYGDYGLITQSFLDDINQIQNRDVSQSNRLSKNVIDRHSQYGLEHSAEGEEVKTASLFTRTLSTLKNNNHKEKFVGIISSLKENIGNSSLHPSKLKETFMKGFAKDLGKAQADDKGQKGSKQDKVGTSKLSSFGDVLKNKTKKNDSKNPSGDNKDVREDIKKKITGKTSDDVKGVDYNPGNKMSSDIKNMMGIPKGYDPVTDKELDELPSDKKTGSGTGTEQKTGSSKEKPKGFNTKKKVDTNKTTSKETIRTPGSPGKESNIMGGIWNFVKAFSAGSSSPNVGLGTAGNIAKSFVKTVKSGSSTRVNEQSKTTKNYKERPKQKAGTGTEQKSGTGTEQKSGTKQKPGTGASGINIGKNHTDSKNEMNANLGKTPTKQPPTQGSGVSNQSMLTPKTPNVSQVKQKTNSKSNMGVKKK